MVRAEAPAAATCIRAADAVIAPHAVLVAHEVALSEVALDGGVPRCGALRPHYNDCGIWLSLLGIHIDMDMLLGGCWLLQHGLWGSNRLTFGDIVHLKIDRFGLGGCL